MFWWEEMERQDQKGEELSEIDQNSRIQVFILLSAVV